MPATIRRAFGIVLIVTGLVAIPIPVIPSILLITAGAAMLGRDHPLVRSSRARLRSIAGFETRTSKADIG